MRRQAGLHNKPVWRPAGKEVMIGMRMRYFLIEYVTRDGEHEYSEYAVTAARSQAGAEKSAKRGRRQFTRVGWEEFCVVSDIREIPSEDYRILGKYFSLR
jgi:hypothetical protein